MDDSPTAYPPDVSKVQRERVGTVWLAATALQAMKSEATHRAPKETGGVLLGYWSNDALDVVITEVVGPGPEASHRRRSFVPDHHYHESEVARLYFESGRRVVYLGDWHSHPGGLLKLSAIDLMTQLRISRSVKARAPMALMLLLAGGNPWLAGAWRLGGDQRRKFWPLTFVSALCIKEFTEG